MSGKPRAGAKGRSRSRAQVAPELDRHALYELCAQSPERDARVLRAIHAWPSEPVARKRLVLGEDFCGTAALSRAWTKLFPGSRAVAVDHDPDVIERGIAAMAPPSPAVSFVVSDVLRARDRVDLIAVLNFSIGEIHERRGLVRYLRHARSRLRRGGAFICDIYDGADRFNTGIVSDSARGPRGERIRYEWEQRTADPLTARVENAMHFRVTEGRRTREMRDAFMYRWRLWSIPELRDAMREAGFGAAQVFPRHAEATDADGNLYAQPIEDAWELGDSFNVFLVARPSEPGAQ